MNTLTATLCKKPILGVVMWLSFMCGSNQAIQGSPKIDLSKVGEIYAQTISVPMDEGYGFSLSFRFETWEAYNRQGPAGDVSMSNAPACKSSAEYHALPSTVREKLGAELKVQIDVTSLDGRPVASTEFTSRCVTSWGNKDKTRADRSGNIQLKKGNYRLSLKNLEPIQLPPDVSVLPTLHGEGIGFP